MLKELQESLETLYRIDTTLDVSDFIIDAEARDSFGVARSPQEQLLVSENDDELELALFVDPTVLRNLRENDPRQRLDLGNLGDFLLTIEGVSHFVYVVWRAQNERPVSGLELELQAEVDKYVTCVMTSHAQGKIPSDLRSLLFEQFTLADDLTPAERERYVVANNNAAAYARSLDRRYLRTNNLGDMLTELRRFYRLGAQEKLEHIARAA